MSIGKVNDNGTLNDGAFYSIQDVDELISKNGLPNVDESDAGKTLIVNSDGKFEIGEYKTQSNDSSKLNFLEIIKLVNDGNIVVIPYYTQSIGIHLAQIENITYNTETKEVSWTLVTSLDSVNTLLNNLDNINKVYILNSFETSIPSYYDEELDGDYLYTVCKMKAVMYNLSIEEYVAHDEFYEVFYNFSSNNLFASINDGVTKFFYYDSTSTNKFGSSLSPFDVTYLASSGVYMGKGCFVVDISNGALYFKDDVSGSYRSTYITNSPHKLVLGTITQITVIIPSGYTRNNFNVTGELTKTEFDIVEST